MVRLRIIFQGLLGLTVILGCQPTVRPVVAIESVFQINVGLTMRSSEPTSHDQTQLRSAQAQQREMLEFQDPNRKTQLRTHTWGWSCGERVDSAPLSIPPPSPLAA